MHRQLNGVNVYSPCGCAVTLKDTGMKCPVCGMPIKDWHTGEVTVFIPCGCKKDHLP